MPKDPYKKSAKVYDKFVEPSIATLRRLGLNIHPPQKGMRVLDIGCGTGTNLELYHEAGCDVYGIDLSPAMIQVAKMKLGERAEIRLGDATNLPYSDDSFDLLTGFFILHEMPNKMRFNVLSQMVRVMKPDGRILLIDYHPGPIRFPRGWIYKIVILFFEIMAGRISFKRFNFKTSDD
jgi:ubiquinone/menaquinone biosynthesis C-methylase UbiE